MSVPDTYPADVAAFLRLPELPHTARGELQVRCTFRPSFDPECAVWFRGGDSPDLAIHSVEKSIWRCLNAREGHFSAEPKVDWIEPQLSIERRPVGAAQASAIRQAAESFLGAPPLRNGLGVDGMVIRIETGLDGASFPASELWVASRSHDPREDLVRCLIRIGLEVAQWQRTSSALAGLARYVGDER